MTTPTKIDSQDKLDHAIWKAFPQYHTQMLGKTNNQKTLFRIYTYVIINNNVDNGEQMLLTLSDQKCILTIKFSLLNPQRAI